MRSKHAQKKEKDSRVAGNKKKHIYEEKKKHTLLLLHCKTQEEQGKKTMKLPVYKQVAVGTPYGGVYTGIYLKYVLYMRPSLQERCSDKSPVQQDTVKHFMEV